MTPIELVTQSEAEFMLFFASRFPVFHLSNVFYLDLKCALKDYLGTNHIKLSDQELESALNALIVEMVSAGILRQISNGTWTLNYPEFRTQRCGRPAGR